MSGGSFNYLCFAENFLERENDIAEIREALLGFDAADVVQEIDEALASMKSAQARFEPLRGVMKAVEWCVSCDTGPDDVARALAEYRAKKDTP